MGGSGEETEWPTPSPFVRGSSLRTTRRVKTNDPPFVPPRHPARPQSKQQDRPPLPPPRHTEDSQGKMLQDVARCHSLRSNTPSRIPALQMPPQQNVRKSYSLHDETRARLRMRDRPESQTLPPSTTAFFPVTAEEASPNLINNDDILSRQLPSPPMSPTSTVPVFRRNSSIAGHTSYHAPPQVQASQGSEARRSFMSLFRRATSSSPQRNGSQAAEVSSNNHDESKPSQNRNSRGTSIPHAMLGRIQDRSMTPSPHRTTPAPSPTTYRRARHASDTPPPSSFKRSGSVPLQRTSLNRKVGSEVTTAFQRICSQSMRLPRTNTQQNPQPEQNTSPWGDGSYMLWPLKPYTPRSSQPETLQAPLGYAPPPPCGAPAQLEDLGHELTTSRTCLLPRHQDSHIPTLTQVARPRLTLRGCHDNTGFRDSGINNNTSSSNSSGSSGSPTTPTTTTPAATKTFIRHPHLTDNRDGEDPGISLDGSSRSGSSCSSSDTSSTTQSRQSNLPLSPRNSIASLGYGSESPESVHRTLSMYSEDSGVEVWGCIGGAVDMVEQRTPTDNFSYLLANDKEYLENLEHLLSDYRVMYGRTPPHIRQHFDMIFRQLELIFHFQEMLHESLKTTGGDVSNLTKVLRDDQFQCYSQYLIMTPAVQRDFNRYLTYFQEHYPDLLRNILKPAFRLNFYAMILESFKKGCSDSEVKKIESTVEYLNKLKRTADTEMTLTAVVESPVDLRLGGDLLHLGDLTCMAAALLHKKKYSLILFENLLVITSSKMVHFKYKTHFRVEQIEKVESVGRTELVLHVLTEGQAQRTTIRFRARTQILRNQWVEHLQKIAEQNQKTCTRGRHTKCGTELRDSSRLLPLELHTLYPLLGSTLTSDKWSIGNSRISLEGDYRFQLITEEKKYLISLSKLLNPESLLPTIALSQLLERLYELHKKGILPFLEQSHSTNEILKWFEMNIDLFSIYSEYLVTRSQATLPQDTPTALYYISPVQHFKFYLDWLRQLGRNPAHLEVAEKIRHRFLDYVMQAKLQLVSQAIANGRIDFQRSGDLIRYDKMDVKTRKKEIRGGTYYALLFQNVIILTKPRAPYYEYAWDIWLDQVNLGPPCTSDAAFKLEVRQGGGREPVTFEFTAATSTTKQEWLSSLHKQMLEQAEKIRRHSSR